jgi:leucyl aminopeptidase
MAGTLLGPFTGDQPRPHLDTAGPAFRTTAESHRPGGGTGFGVRRPADCLLPKTRGPRAGLTPCRAAFRLYS